MVSRTPSAAAGPAFRKNMSESTLCACFSVTALRKLHSASPASLTRRRPAHRGTGSRRQPGRAARARWRSSHPAQLRDVPGTHPRRWSPRTRTSRRCGAVSEAYRKEKVCCQPSDRPTSPWVVLSMSFSAFGGAQRGGDQQEVPLPVPVPSVTTVGAILARTRSSSSFLLVLLMRIRSG